MIGKEFWKSLGKISSRLRSEGLALFCEGVAHSEAKEFDQANRCVQSGPGSVAGGPRPDDRHLLLPRHLVFQNEALAAGSDGLHGSLAARSETSRGLWHARRRPLSTG